MTLIFIFILFSILEFSSAYLLPLDRNSNAYIQLMIPFGGPNHRQCFYTHAAACFLKPYQEDPSFLSTWSNAYMTKEKIDIDWDPLINIQFTKDFVNFFSECSNEILNDLLKPNTVMPFMKEIIALGRTPKNISIPFGSEIKLRHQQNIYLTVQNCLRSIPCFIKIHQQTIANIIEDCSNQSYKLLEIPLEEFYESEKAVEFVAAENEKQQIN